MKLSAESWYMPAPMNGGQSMAKTNASEREKKWLNRLRESRRELAALEATAASHIVERRRRERQAVTDEILKAIQTVPSRDQRSVLILRYVKCLEWHEVATTLHFSERHVMRLHSEALKKIRLPQRQKKWAENAKQ